MIRRTARDWIPLWIDKWIFGSTRHELQPDEQSVWIDLLALAGKDDGYIRASETIPYPLPQLAGLLCKDVELISRTIEKCIKYEKIERLENGILRVKNWEKYQLSERHNRRYKSKKEDTMSEKTDTMSAKTDTDTYTDTDTKYNIQIQDTDTEKDVNDKVNWNNCKNDNQKFIAWWVKNESPELYATATKKQATALFKRFGRDVSTIINICGDLNKAIEASDKCRKWLKGKGLSYNLTTIARNISKFLAGAIPSYIDIDLIKEYIELKKEIEGKDISIEQVVKLLEGKPNANKLLEEKIVELKRKNVELPQEMANLIKKVADGKALNMQEGEK